MLLPTLLSALSCFEFPWFQAFVLVVYCYHSDQWWVSMSYLKSEMQEYFVQYIVYFGSSVFIIILHIGASIQHICCLFVQEAVLLENKGSHWKWFLILKVSNHIFPLDGEIEFHHYQQTLQLSLYIFEFTCLESIFCNAIYYRAVLGKCLRFALWIRGSWEHFSNW